MTTKTYKLIVVFLLFFGFILRLYQIDQPLGDWHSWRQSDTAAVTWFLNQNFDLLHPRFFDISPIPSGLPNPNGYRFVEFPIFNLLHLFTFKIITLTPLASIFNYPFEAAGRLVNIIFWLIAGLALSSTIKDLTKNQNLSLLTLFFFLFLPYNIFYSRVILPDPLTVSLSLISLYFYTRYFLFPQLKTLIPALIFTTLALLTKPYAVFIIYPSIWLLTAFNLHLDLSSKLKLFFATLIPTIPLTLWRWWMTFYPAGIPANKWLFNAGNMRLKPVWWRWLFYERLGKLILGSWGTAFLLLAPLSLSYFNKKTKPRSYFYLFVAGLTFGALAYLIIFARGNIQHDYYQIITLPTLVILLALGAAYFLHLTNQQSPLYRLINFATLAFVIFFTLIFSWYQIKEYYKINDLETIKIIEQIKPTLPPDAKIITDYQGNSLLLYHFKRFGWPTLTASLTQLYQQGARYYFSPTPNQTTQQLSSICQNIKRIKNTYLIDLTSCHYAKN